MLNKPFNKQNSPWKNQAIQRDFILKELNGAGPDDYIMFSDPDEIPNPKIFKKFNLKKNLEYFYRKCIATNLIYTINMKVCGKVQEYVKKRICFQ